MTGVEQEARHKLVQAQSLPLRETGVDDVFQGGVTEPPSLLLAGFRVTHDHLAVLEQVQLFGGRVRVDDGKLAQVERIPEDRRVTSQVAEPRGHRGEPGAADRLHNWRARPR